MTFSLFESSRSKARPYFLYLIRYGAGANDFYAFTDNETPVVRNGVTYQVMQIAHGGVVSTGSMDKTVVEVTTPRTNPLFELFRVYPPNYRVRLTIVKGHNSDSGDNGVVIWSGRILSMSVRGIECTFNCEPISTTMRRLGLRRNWQYGCPHPLYQSGCFASREAVRQTATVVSVTGAEVTLAAGWNGPIASDKFVGGYVESSGATPLYRSILRVTGNKLLVAGSLGHVAAGGTISVYPGCGHNMGDCKNIHDNIVNFGGQAWIPSDNPVGSKNNFY